MTSLSDQWSVVISHCKSQPAIIHQDGRTTTTKALPYDPINTFIYCISQALCGGAGIVPASTIAAHGLNVNNRHLPSINSFGPAVTDWQGEGVGDNDNEVGLEMKPSTKKPGSRNRIIFPGRAVVASILQAKGQQQQQYQQIQQHQRQRSMAADTAVMRVPDLFKSNPLIRDELETDTSRAQDNTVNVCLPYLSASGHDHHNDHGLPPIDRKKHIAFLHAQLGRLPPQFYAADASRPWWLYWCLNALRLLGEDVSDYRDSLIETARSMQNDTGGFGGGNGQMSHLATTYAVVLALALVGGDEVYDVVDRRALWKWLCTLKQPSGGFQMATGGEVDVR